MLGAQNGGARLISGFGWQHSSLVIIALQEWGLLFQAYSLDFLCAISRFKFFLNIGQAKQSTYAIHQFNASALLYGDYMEIAGIKLFWILHLQSWL